MESDKVVLVQKVNNSNNRVRCSYSLPRYLVEAAKEKARDVEYGGNASAVVRVALSRFLQANPNSL